MLKEISVIAIAMGVLWTGALSAQTSSCLPVDEEAEALEVSAKTLVTSTEEFVVQARERADVPVVDTSSVQLVQDDSVCQEAVTAYNKEVGDKPNTQRKIHMVKIGPTRYMVFDPNVTASGWRLHMVLDENFRKVYSYTG